ncbi:nitrous oxidase accessory protein NosD [Phenylobacterium haematophilum]|jgi:nitrous oxidase accessory protein NosD|uniref:Nitrous oxidase accessory protein NosD n=1 Tax=Phenylobacterium haematophilum TaxID=98513 RepID=A0A840A309_9CAUL|nr:right-handed parallel beta-helix repeat-containing protein [Phenylobacterium haematophilum]MBB3892063.1 nitrous oxidase accessory protein NosD [Phenylobacterium haematophilum]
MLEILLLALAADAAPQQAQSVERVAQRGPVTVRNALTLTLAMKTASPGATVVLAPGDYGQIALSDLNFGTPVTLVAKDAQTAGFVLKNVTGLRVVGLNVVLDQPGAGRLAVNDSQNIQFSGLTARGLPTGQGLFFTKSRNIRVEKSSFSGFRNGIVLSNCYDVAIEGSTFRRLGADGVTSNGTSRLLIKGNDFADFAPTPGSHPDAVQLFTRNTTASAEDITIVGNRIRRGSGGIMQGIFITDQVGTLPYRRVVIRDNIIEGSMYNGIALMHAEDVEVSGNTVQPYAGMNARINLSGVTGAQVFNNRYWKLLQSDNKDIVVKDRPSLSPIRAPAAP